MGGNRTFFIFAAAITGGEGATAAESRMMTKEQEEKKYLEEFFRKVNIRIADVDQSIRLKKEEIDSMHKHMQDHKRDMDHLDKNALRETIRNYSSVGEHGLETKKRLHKLKEIGYFGRIDFRPKEATEKRKIYVGVHNLQDTESKSNIVYDWRAPISSMFYDFELGAATYETHEGTVEGQIDLKRQFRIRNQEIEYMLDTDVTIHDEVLQKELNRASSDKMKNIVATIQKQQNAIIRDEEARHLIIQGVAGSGKTSIALHRIAYLLYRFKETISSEDVLIISPNKVFANYISNVLPELGEESVAETRMEDIADEILEHQIKFQSFAEQVAELLEKPSEKLIERIQFKSSPELIKKMDAYAVYLENEGFEVHDIFVKGKPVPDWFIKESFQRYRRMPLLKRFNEVVREIVENVYRFYKIEVQYDDRRAVHQAIRKMFPSYSVKKLYKGFYEWLERPDLLKKRKGGTYEWSDVFAFIYLKMKLEGLRRRTEVKHLVIDEMQDYSPVQYHVLNRLYPGKKTILGDINQSVNPFSSSNVDTIQDIMGLARTMTLLKSYRSTYEITEFSKRVNPGVQVEPLARHGEEPQIIRCDSADQEIAQLEELICDFQDSEYQSLGLICKTQPQANAWYEALEDIGRIQLLSPESVAFGSGIVITTAHLAKGLEFDQVIVPEVTEKNYSTEPDRQMLYVACTRAMHRLVLTHRGTRSSLIE